MTLYNLFEVNCMENYYTIMKAIFTGLFTGIVASIPLGPAALESIKRTVTKGYKEGFLVSLGAVGTDAFDIILINIGILGVLETNKVLENSFWIISGIILSIMGYISFKKVKNHDPEFKPEILQDDNIKSMPLMSGFLISFLNPMTHTFWLTLSGTVIRVWRYAGNVPYYAFIFSILAGMIAWFALLNYLALKGRKIVAPESSEKVSKILAWGISGIGVGFVIVGALRLIIMYR
jgi:threonine/homoserine/homoserine lactone efflux protein